MAAPAKITITVEGPLIEIAGDDGTVLRLRADGKKVPDRTYTGLEFERKTKWDGEVLVTEFELKDSEAKARQTWTRTGTQLKVFTKLTPPHGADPLEVRRGYDLEARGSSSAVRARQVGGRRSRNAVLQFTPLLTHGRAASDPTSRPA